MKTSYFTRYSFISIHSIKGKTLNCYFLAFENGNKPTRKSSPVHCSMETKNNESVAKHKENNSQETPLQVKAVR